MQSVIPLNIIFDLQAYDDNGGQKTKKGKTLKEIGFFSEERWAWITKIPYRDAHMERS